NSCMYSAKSDIRRAGPDRRYLPRLDADRRDNDAERKLADGLLRHGGQRLMPWAVANARMEPIGNAIIITKQASESGEIDPLMAAFNAITLMSTNPWSSRPSIFVI